MRARHAILKEPDLHGGPASIGAGSLRYLGTVAVCILLAATLLACTGGGEDSARDERVLELEAKAHSLEESLEALADENAELKGEIAILREHLDDRDAKLEELEEVVSKAEWVLPGKPESTDGRREDSGRGVRELQARWPGLHWGRWEGGGRSSVAAQGPYGRLRGLRCAGW